MEAIRDSLFIVWCQKLDEFADRQYFDLVEDETFAEVYAEGESLRGYFDEYWSPQNVVEHIRSNFDMERYW